MTAVAQCRYSRQQLLRQFGPMELTRARSGPVLISVDRSTQPMAVEVSSSPFNNSFSIYRMRNHTQTNTRSHIRNVLLIWLDPEMHWHGHANGKPGRSPTFSDNAVQFCLAIKGLLDLPLRQAMDLTKQLLRAAGLNWPVPDFSTVSRRRKQLREVVVDMTDPLGVHLLVDDGGIQIMSVGDWEIRHQFRRCETQWVRIQLNEKCR